MDKFLEELEETLLRFDDPAFFEISTTYSAVYHRFLALDLADRPAIRGQLDSIGISFFRAAKPRCIKSRSDFIT
jgi:hypothetical protein